MGNNNSSNNLSTDSTDASIPTADDIFKVDNINSYGRKHASAKIQVSNDSLCIRQKNRQPLYIPLETIKRYGLDGSIFILECGRRAPFGPARYAFRCKQARRLVECLDQRIAFRSKQLLEQQRRGTTISSSSTITNVSSVSQHQRRRQQNRSQPRPHRTQSDQGINHRVPSSILFTSSSSSSSISLTSRATFSYRNSEPNLSENYQSLSPDVSHRVNNNSHTNVHTTTGDNRERARGHFIARLKQPIEKEIIPELNYVEFKSEQIPVSMNDNGSIATVPTPVANQTSSAHQRQKLLPSSMLNHHQQSNSIKTQPVNQSNAPMTTNSVLKSSSTNAPYVYIDHEKTITLKEIANQRLQHQQARRVEA